MNNIVTDETFKFRVSLNKQKKSTNLLRLGIFGY